MSASPDVSEFTKNHHESATLNAILNSVVDGIITIDSYGSIATFNAAAERIFGYSAGEVIGENVCILMPEPYHSAHDDYVGAYLSTGEAKVIGIGREVSALRKDGTVFPIDLAVGEIAYGEQRMFVGIIRDITDRKQAERERDLNHDLLGAISSIQSKFILDGDPRAAFDQLLDKILEITNSEYGFIGEVRRQEDGTPFLKTQAITNIAWNDETRQFYEKNAPQGLEFFNLKTLFGSVITTGKPVIANHPLDDPRRGGLPSGHPALNAFLGLPFHMGDRMVGMIGIANRPNGYDEQLIEFLTPLTTTCGNLVGSLESTRQRIAAEEALRDANDRLAKTVAEIQDRNREITLLSELEELLQSCETRSEAYRVVAHMSKQLFPNFNGAIYGAGNEAGILELMQSWGYEDLNDLFPTHECIAVRRGRPHISAGEASPLNCLHVDTEKHISLCVPLIGKSESFGVLHFFKPCTGASVDIPEEMRELAVTVSRRIAVAFANLKLSESLREQSIRDPLTHLFNRRYMTETLERELHRAQRDQGSSVCLVLFDLDHFKQINDTYGHSAGDTVLVELAAIINQHSRKSDVACRLGGEEFVLVLPNCPLEIAKQRAEQIRRSVSELVCTHGGQSLGQITVSAGVAVYPECANQSTGLLQAADAALYRAKDMGRNRVELAATADS